MTNKTMLSERDNFEVFWRLTMNVQDMDLHRCEFPMTAYDDQPYACHETERGRMAWMARALLDKPAAQHQGEPVAVFSIDASGYRARTVLDPSRPLPADGTLLYADQPAPVELTVWYGSMPESNGKTNWTAILHRKGGEGSLLGVLSDGITIERSEYPDRVRYEADRMRYLIGELKTEPWILDYDENKHSGYVRPEQPAPVSAAERCFHCNQPGGQCCTTAGAQP